MVSVIVEKKLLIEQIKELFIFFQAHIYPDYPEKSFSKREEKMILNFLNHYEEKQSSINIEWLKDYFLFQYDYWYDLKTKRAISLNWIIGDKARDRWNNKKGAWRYFIFKGLLKHIDNFHFRLLENKIEEKKIKEEKRQFLTSLKPWEEEEKVRFFNSEKGFAWCILHTLLYHPDSQHCWECKNKGKCQQLQLENYPNIIRSTKNLS